MTNLGNLDRIITDAPQSAIGNSFRLYFHFELGKVGKVPDKASYNWSQAALWGQKCANALLYRDCHRSLVAGQSV